MKSPLLGREYPRDQDESDFTPILRDLAREKGVLAVAFVDTEGECVDYCGVLPPYDTKVAGALLWTVMAEVHQRSDKLGNGESYGVWVETDTRSFYVRRVSDDYALVLVLEVNVASANIEDLVTMGIDRLRITAEMATPHWDPTSESLEVDLRDSVGWAYAPAAFQVGAARVAVAAVLGKWVPDQRGAIVCFRVRTEEGEELTLEHDLELGRWTRKVDRL